MDELSIAKCLKVISVSYPGRFEPVNGTAEIWHGLLSDVPDETGIAAVAQLCASEVYPPTISQIREKALDLAEGNVAAPSAWEAWDRALQGQPGTSIEKRARELIGGSWEIHHSENIGVTRSNFVKAYSELLDRDRKRRLAIPAVKILADENRPEPEETPVDSRIESSDYVAATPEQVKKLLLGLHTYHTYEAGGVR